jgi:hypothetical protein
VNEGRPEPVVQLVTVLLAIAAQVFAYEYSTNSDFRYSVNGFARQLRYQVRRARWRQGYALLKGWQKEAIEQVHGRPEL